jgi:hypothetical protein
MSDTDRTTTHTRRSAIRTGGLSALGVGLMTAAGAPPAPVGAEPLTVATVSNLADIIAEVVWRVEQVRGKDHAAQVAQNALSATLTPEQHLLLMAYEEADNDRDFEQMDLYIVELGRHLPGLHPAIWALWRHIVESSSGECCMPDVDGGES